MEKKKSGKKAFFVHLGLIALASFLFALSFPNLLFKNGLPFFAWFAYIPILIVIRNCGFFSCAFWGAVYGYASYSLFNYWLGAFHPLAGVIVCGICLVFLSAVFLLMKLAEKLYPNRSYLIQWIIWLAYEYLSAYGFLAYSYGITGYSQWRVIPLIQIASITGVWGVSALVTFPSFWLAAALNEENFNHESYLRYAHEPYPRILRLCSRWFVVKILNFFRKEKIAVIIWATILAASLVFGFIKMSSYAKDSASSATARIALVQHNTDPWLASKAGSAWQITDAYRTDLAVLKRLSDLALAENPKPDMVVWPETAFVPRIYWHSTYRDDQNSWLLVKELLEYLSTKDTPFLIGNDDALKDTGLNPNDDEKNRVDYNAALLFENGKIMQSYRKIHLVPFTENFPYKKQFPAIYAALKKADTHFWEKGKEATVFKGPGFTFSAPICFEDSFGYLSRNFVKNGAEVLINMTNDAWSKSLPAQNQHLSIAVFRAVENYRPMVRATVSGQTCAINPLGKVTEMAQPFTEAWIIVKIPLIKKNTLYTHYGDFVGIGFTIAAVILLLYGAVWVKIRRGKDNGNP